jgi:enterochelin esterase family protein
MIAAGAIPPLVAVMIANPTGDPARRLHELMGAADFAELVHDELMPWVRGTHNVTDDPARTIIAGSSLGGLMAAFLGYHQSDLFGNVLSQSGSFWWRSSDEHEHVELARLYRDAQRLPLRFFLEVGILETVTTPGNGPSQVVANRHLRDVLLAKGYDVAYREYGGGHNYLAWQITISDGLIALLKPGWTCGTPPDGAPPSSESTGPPLPVPGRSRGTQLVQ